MDSDDAAVAAEHHSGVDDRGSVIEGGDPSAQGEQGARGWARVGRHRNSCSRHTRSAATCGAASRRRESDRSADPPWTRRRLADISLETVDTRLPAGAAWWVTPRTLATREDTTALTFDPGAPPSTTFDKGPPAELARHFAAVPGYLSATSDHRDLFWWDWGPVFYRGRLNKTAKVIGIASDPGPTERLVGRTLVGDAGQRVQGLLAKLGFTHSYVLVNAFAYAVHPSRVPDALPLLADPTQATWRNRFYDLVNGPDVQAVIAFGGNAQAALTQWTTAPQVPTFNIPHPSDHNTADLLTKWNAALPGLRAAVTSDPGGPNTGPGYGTSFTEADYTAIPAADLPFGVPTWIGNDAWGRTAQPVHNNCVDRSTTDLNHTLIWQAPASS